MRRLLLLLLAALPVAAQGMGRAEDYTWLESPHNKKRLRMAWDMLPPHAPVNQLDGSTKPAGALAVRARPNTRDLGKLQTGRPVPIEVGRS